MLAAIRIVLVNPSHPGNIGATARAMKNMGLSALSLVKPLHFPDPEATHRASGAEDLLMNAQICEDLPAALHDCHLVYGASVRQRDLAWPLQTARVAATEIIKAAQHCRVAIIFGNEQSGLSNEDLARCQKQLYIPSDPTFSSLNLAQAVQVVCYELRQALQENKNEINQQESAGLKDLATQIEVENFYQHLEQVLTTLHFLNPKKPKYLAQRLRRIFARTHLEKSEVAIWRGILTAITKQGMK